MITCAEAVRQLWDYLDGVVDEPSREAIEEHLSFCRRCCGEVEFAQELRTFLAAHAAEELPRRRARAARRHPRPVRAGDGVTSDLLHGDEVKAIVREAYGAVDAGTRAVVRKLYSLEELALVPDSAVDRALGVANHLRHAELGPDDVVLDLGCGAGIDTILAAWSAQRAIGLDFVPAMLERTRSRRRPGELDERRDGPGRDGGDPARRRQRRPRDLERRHQPLAAQVARAGRVRARAGPGGRLTVSDLTVDEEELPSEILTHPPPGPGEWPAR